MKNKIIFSGIIICAFLLAGCAQSPQGEPTQDINPPAGAQPSVQQTVVNNVDAALTPVNSVPVTINNFSFSPADLTVTKGTTVVWTNQDTPPHTITSAGLFDSGNISTGGTFSYTFKEAGTFNYNCTIHPSMKGSVTVQ
jgi:plastocyanin